jgi:predicted helicase
MQTVPHQMLTAFRKHIPPLARELTHHLHDLYEHHQHFRRAFDEVIAACQQERNRPVSVRAAQEMLVQHVFTERLLQAVFHDTTALCHNEIAMKIEKTLRTLPFDRQALLAPLDPIYAKVEQPLQDMDWKEKRMFLSTLYEQFFQVFSREQARQYGVVYTPPEVIHFMCRSVEQVLQQEFHHSFSSPVVKLLDPCTGTGAFILSIMDLITDTDALTTQYDESLFCNEILLYPYYLAGLTIEQEYVRRVGAYKPFQGICFMDTLQRDSTFDPLSGENIRRITREHQAPIMVIIGNPPYNVGQKQEQWSIDQRISTTYSAQSVAPVRNHYYSDYVRFLRWSTDRLQGHAGIICLLTNNRFIRGSSFDGVRKLLEEEFTHLYHVDLGGDVRQGSPANIMEGRVGVGITLLVRTRPYEEQKEQPARIYYHQLEHHRSPEKTLPHLITLGDTNMISSPERWQIIHPDAHHAWPLSPQRHQIQQGIPLGMPGGKREASDDEPVIFRMYSSGIKTNRDRWVYDEDRHLLATKMQQFITLYNLEVERLYRSPSSAEQAQPQFSQDIKWSRELREHLQRGTRATYDETWIRESLYRPFFKKYFYADPLFSTSMGQQLRCFPHPAAEEENAMIAIPGLGNRLPFSVLATNKLATMDMGFEKALYFPYYFYEEGQRQENITAWALQRFRQSYGPQVTKRDILHYLYAILHHPSYREQHVGSTGLPRIPLVGSNTAFETCTLIGAQLLHLHVSYEQQAPSPLERQDKQFAIPSEAAHYRMGNSPAYRWIQEQATSRQKGDPVLLRQVVTVCMETARLMQELAQQVPEAQWRQQEGTETGGQTTKEQTPHTKYPHCQERALLVGGMSTAALLFGGMFLWRHLKERPGEEAKDPPPFS